MKIQNRKLTTSATAVLLALLATNFATAATTTWDGGGGDGNFSTGLNWVDDLPATAGGTFTFAGTTNLNATNDLAFVGTTDTALTFAVGAGSFVLSGVNNMRTGGITNSSSNVQTIGFGVRFNGGRTIDTGAAGINFTAIPASTGTGRTITKAGSGDLTFSFAGTTTNLSYTVNAGRLVAANTSGTQLLPAAVTLAASTSLVLDQAGTANVGGIISGAGSVIKTGAGGSTFSGANTYTGGTTVEEGILTVANSFTMSGANAFSLAGAATPTVGVDNGSISATAGTFSYGGDLTLNFSGTAVNGASYDLFNLSGATLGLTSFGNVSISGSYTASLSNSLGVWTGTSSGVTFTFTEASGDLLISAIPEPSTWAAIAGLMGLGFAASRRRRAA